MRRIKMVKTLSEVKLKLFKRLANNKSYVDLFALQKKLIQMIFLEN